MHYNGSYQLLALAFNLSNILALTEDLPSEKGRANIVDW